MWENIHFISKFTWPYLDSIEKSKKEDKIICPKTPPLQSSSQYLYFVESFFSEENGGRKRVGGLEREKKVGKNGGEMGCLYLASM